MPNDLSSKKRGRPSKYASKEEKRAADARRKRTKRESERDLDHAFRAVELPAMRPELPPAMPTFSKRDGTASFPSEPFAEELASGSTNFEGNDFFSYLPSNSPSPAPISDNRITEPSSPTGISSTLLEVRDNRTINNANATPDPQEDSTSSGTIEQTTSPLPSTETTGTDVVDLAARLVDQLIAFRGCCAQCHDEARQCHRQEDREHVGIREYLDANANLCPDILASERVAVREDKLIDRIAAATRRKLYTGLCSEASADQGIPPHICLRKDEQRGNSVSSSFDVDSVVAFPTSLAVAKHGIQWHPSQTAVPALKSSLHLRSREVVFQDETGHTRTGHRPVHQIPHYVFGRLVGLESISLCLLFPRLYRPEQQSSRLRDEDFRIWIDGILLPAIYEQYTSSHVQHLPSSFDHGRYNATARGVEGLSQRVDPVARVQQLASYLSPEGLSLVWKRILAAVQRPPYYHFQGVTILLQAKNLKVLTKDFTWEAMIGRFRSYWTHAIDESFITSETFFDIGKETCPRQFSFSYLPTGSSETNEAEAHNTTDPLENAAAETLLWKRCCLESYINSVQHTSNGDPTQKQTFYPFSMLHETGSLTIESSPASVPRAAGLLYTQFYPSAKEMFAAGDVYPFRNAAIETLALDKRLRRTWELVGGGLSHNPVALMKAYIHMKLRCHFALRGSVRKSFGVREEHRVSKALFDTIDAQFRSRGIQNQRLISQTAGDDPYHTFTTATITEWLRWNINKFSVGFETICSSQDPYFFTWEHTRVMLMFLRCLEFSYSGGLIQKAGGCWQDVRFQEDARQPNGVRRVEGLGFRLSMEMHGYAWFLDKVDWVTFTFRQPYAPYMMFNNPSMQTAYRARYRQIRDVRLDFIRVDRARQWMTEFSETPACLDLLERYMCQLCLCAFRKDVFTHIQSVLLPPQRDAALAGEIPLCYSAITDVLQEAERDLMLARGHRLTVKNVDVLFAWLWEWKDGRFERKGWNEKPYRMLFYQAFHAVQSIRGLAAARTWRKQLKQSFLRSHWMLPYPHGQGFMRKDKDTKRFVWWPTFHYGLNQYYKRLARYGTQKKPFPASNIKHHPATGWTLATMTDPWWASYMPYVVEPEKDLLEKAEEVIYAELVQCREQAAIAGTTLPTAAETRVLEFSIGTTLIEGTVTRWCNKKRASVPMEFGECTSPAECSRFLRQELERYELLQHHRSNLRERRHARSIKNSVCGSEDGARSPSADTSDDESLSQKRQQLAISVHYMANRIYDMISKERKQYVKPDLWEVLIKSYEFRVKQVVLS